ncbi:MAG: tetratricopeptide repeat protein [Pseudomonadales bacterium]|nr:tetratricopeptide repeat protein [Pseudomonadales bacterium]
MNSPENSNQSSSQAVAEAYRLFLHKQLNPAQNLCESILQSNPTDATALNLMGMIWMSKNQAQTAIIFFQKALTEQKAAYLYNNLGTAQQRCGQFEQALDSYIAGYHLNPDAQTTCDILYNLGNVYLALEQHDKAAGVFIELFKHQPEYRDGLEKLVGIFLKAGDVKQAINYLRKRLKHKPSDHHAQLALELAKRKLCLWLEADNLSQSEVHELLAKGAKCDPLAIMSLTDAPELLLSAARATASSSPVPASLPPAKSTRAETPLIKLAYLSSDFRQHPVGSLIVSLLEQHRRNRFKVYAYSTGKDDGSAIRRRIRRAVDVFRDMSEADDTHILEQIRADDIGILIDLNGYTEGSKTALLASRPAPVQINFLGFAGTVGADFMDYLLTDRYVLPPAQRMHVTETPLYLDRCYLPFDASQTLSKRLRRADYKLPDDALVFCCFNNSYKLSAEVFSIWIQVLHASPGSVLWLGRLSDHMRPPIIEFAQSQGISPDRIVFAARVDSRNDYLARFQLADLFLDTYPYNGHTVCAEALWSGCPVLTCSGRSITSRAGGSLLLNLGVPELITQSLDEYTAAALALAANPEKLRHLKEKISILRSSSSLFKQGEYLRDYEDALVSVWTHYLQGGRPSDFRRSPAAQDKD